VARMRMFRSEAVLMGMFAATVSSSALAQQDLEIHMHLSKTTILLGEPVWVDVNVTNRAPESIYIDFGSACFGQRPLKVHIPAADPAVIEPRRCDGGTAGSCASGALPVLQPGETASRRYVLDGDFRISHPGSYEALVEKYIRYVPVATNPLDLYINGSNEKQQIAQATVELTVHPSDPERLLALEQNDAETAMEKPPDPPLPGSSREGNPLDKAALKRAWDRRHAAQLESMLNEDAIAAGLSKYPAAGMEPTFLSWVEGFRYSTYGLVALKRLNTEAAREALANMAGSVARPDDTWFQSFRPQAVDALADLGDKTYVPLMVRLIHDSNHSVQISAVHALGMLGGEEELGMLANLARDGATTDDRFEAIRSIGDTASLKAVPPLIDFVSLPDSNEPSESYYALRTLTHLEFPDPDHRPLPEVESAWLQFWSLHQVNARAYGPYECRVTPYSQRLTQ
jgi:hypothetical protein